MPILQKSFNRFLNCEKWRHQNLKFDVHVIKCLWSWTPFINNPKTFLRKLSFVDKILPKGE